MGRSGAGGQTKFLLKQGSLNNRYLTIAGGFFSKPIMIHFVKKNELVAIELCKRQLKIDGHYLIEVTIL